MNDPGRIVILGAGATGLGAARRLEEVGYPDYVVLEARATPGGLASSYLDARGFTWDVGGHVHFSHYPYYDAMLEEVLGDDRVLRERRAWIWFRDRLVPYPFQYNLHRLDAADCAVALEGLRGVSAASQAPASESFAQWIDRTFGVGIGVLFMRPYNLKVWGYPLERLGVEWIGERVALPNVIRIRRNVREGRDDVAWGPNNRFVYPLRGGTGAIWAGLAASLDATRFAWRTAVAGVDLRERSLRLEDGRRLRYDALISSMALDEFCARCRGLEAGARRAARRMAYSSVHVVGVGLRGEIPERLREISWLYFPGPETPFHRVTVLSNYSPYNVPEGSGFWSLMAEVCESPMRPVNAGTLVRRTVAALLRTGLLPRGTRVVSRWHRREERGYPTPLLIREQVLAAVLPALERHRVYSRGRFGLWRYEVSNQDHCFMQGVELVNRLLGLGEEITIHRPDMANRTRRRRASTT